MQFLRGDFGGTQKVLRPPWSVIESRFTELCNSCGDCISICPSSILVKGRAGYPIVDFSHGECDFCAKCVSICERDALCQTNDPDQAPWKIKASISDTCVTHQDVVCRSCAEQCETQAIVFKLTAGKTAKPKVDESKCSGCGACVSVCPVNAISVA